ncbi:hypothetical protein DPMN_150303 [Dreissena polymorpha]|uniref:Uncharacterized protein n=1 Tax=Dreissena polymorpha TaxID=45954 RepID=A0A9D4FD77_DREPO|nr:hypothetical protein DPMN_150303 [Dreissena polymorpha]
MIWLFSPTPTTDAEKRQTCVADNSARLGLTLHKGKSKVFRTTHPTTHPSQSKARRWRRWTASPISAAFLDNQGGMDADVRARHGKSRAAFHQLEEHLGIKRNWHHHQD